MFNVFQKKPSSPLPSAGSETGGAGKKEKEDLTPPAPVSPSASASLRRDGSQGERGGDNKPLKAEGNDNKSEGREIADNIIIHFMPESFRPSGAAASQHKNIGIVIMVGGALFLLAVLAALYFFLFKTAPTAPIEERAAVSTAEVKTEKKADTPAEAPPSAEPAEPPPARPVDEAKEVYSEMRAGILAAASYGDYEATVKKYGSLKRIAGLEKQKELVNQLDGGERVEFLDLIKQTTPKDEDITDIKGTIDGQTARLHINIKGEPEVLMVEMVLEDNQWKVLDEGGLVLKVDGEFVVLADWLEQTAKSAVSGGFTLGADADGDGLTDAEEMLLGSQSDNQDSDADTYNDLSEVVNLYNPAGSGRLADSANIKRYRNSAYGYDVFYPAGWAESQVGGDDSIMFKSSDNQFVQIIVQPNSAREPIESWFSAQLDMPAAGLETVAGENWRGIKNDDGLIVYLTDNNLNNIYVISYNLGQSNVLEYINIFNMMVKSFTVGDVGPAEQPMDGSAEFIEE